MRIKLIFSALLGAVLLSPVAAGAQDMRLIVDRFDDRVEVYLSLPAEDVPSVLGGTTDQLMTPDGRFEIGVFRETGTAVEGDAVFGDTRLLVNGDPVTVEAMSVMVHPADLPLPLETPIDGIAAMSVCTVPESDEAPRLEALQMYGGFVSWPVDGFGQVALELRNPEPIEVWFGHFAGGKAVSKQLISLPANAVVALAPQPVPVLKERLVVGGALLVAAIMAGFAGYLMMFRTRSVSAGG